MDVLNSDQHDDVDTTHRVLSIIDLTREENALTMTPIIAAEPSRSGREAIKPCRP